MSSGGKASVRQLELPRASQGMKPSLGHGEKTLRGREETFWSGCWNLKNLRRALHPVRRNEGGARD